MSGTVATTPSGSGCDSGSAADPADPCVVSTIEQVQAFEENRAGHYAFGADIDASATEAWNDGAGFEPIADFTGTLDGRGHKVTDLVINQPGTRWVGLFGTAAEGSEIRNLSFEDARVTGGATVGILAGRGAGDIVQVHASGVVNGEEWTGGLVGNLQETGVISRSSTSGSVSGSGARIGGLVGQHDGHVEYSYSLSAVAGRTSVGGLAGRSSGTTQSSYSVVGSEDDGEHIVQGAHSGSEVGGLIGTIEASTIISDSYTVSYQTTDRLGFVGHRLVGHDWGTGDGTSSSYWGTDSTPRQDIARSLEAMRQAATFDGWDFDTVWTIDEDADYPDLISNPRN